MDQTALLLAFSSLTAGTAVGLGVWRFAPIWDGLAMRQMGELAVRFKRLGLDSGQLKLALRCWGAAVPTVGVLLGPVLHMYPLAALAAALAYVAPRHLLDWLILRRSRLLANQMVGAASGLANSVRAGLSIAQGMEALAAEVPLPLGREFRRIAFEYQRGRPIREAIDQVRQRLQIEPFTLFALAIEVTLDRGGRINEVLERLSRSLQENERLARKLEADTAAGVQAVLILAIFPAGFLGMFALFDPPSIGFLFSTVIGQLAVAAIALLVYLGASWAWRIVRVKS
jgi:tight adherence protein B